MKALIEYDETQQSTRLIGSTPSIKLMQSIASLTGGIKRVDVSGKIVWKGDVRDYTAKDGTTGKVVSALLRDESGSINLRLFNDAASIPVAAVSPSRRDTRPSSTASRS
jgi:ssDNA-binding replication factor A large subunit